MQTLTCSIRNCAHLYEKNRWICIIKVREVCLMETLHIILSAHSTEFEYLNDVPVLTVDVNEDFKGDKIKSADMIEKVGGI